jgi:hypothetical protein
VRRNLRSLVMAAAILSLALGGKAVGQDEWQTVTSPDGSFTANLTNVKWSTQQGAVTAEAIGVAGETDERFFAAVKGRNGVDLAYFGPRGTATSSDANRFFASLKIGDDMAPQRGLPPIESTPLQRDQP